MEILLLTLALMGSPEARATNASKESSAKEIIKMNESLFSYKELITKPELCSYHNELLKEVGREEIPCSRKPTPETKDAAVAGQLKEVSKLTQVMEPQVNEMIINMPKRR